MRILLTMQTKTKQHVDDVRRNDCQDCQFTLERSQRESLPNDLAEAKFTFQNPRFSAKVVILLSPKCQFLKRVFRIRGNKVFFPG
jgi:hypothetical protein